MKRTNTYLKVFIFFAILYGFVFAISNLKFTGSDYNVTNYADDTPSLMTDTIDYLSKADSFDTTFLSQYKIPNDQYLAFYFNVNGDSLTNKKIEYESAIHCNYNTKDFNGISDNKLAVVWCGNIFYDKSGLYDFSVLKGASSFTLWIDDKYQMDSTDASAEKTIKLSSGYHKITIEFINHDANKFYFYFEKLLHQRALTLAQTSKFVDDNMALKSDVYYVSVKNSANFDSSIKIILLNNEKPITLILDSEEPVSWSVLDTGHTTANKVIFDSVYGHSVVKGVTSQNLIFNALFNHTLFSGFNTSKINNVDYFTLPVDADRSTIDGAKPFSSSINSLLQYILYYKSIPIHGYSYGSESDIIVISSDGSFTSGSSKLLK